VGESLDPTQKTLHLQL